MWSYPYFLVKSLHYSYYLIFSSRGIEVRILAIPYQLNFKTYEFLWEEKVILSRCLKRTVTWRLIGMAFNFQIRSSYNFYHFKKMLCHDFSVVSACNSTLTGARQEEVSWNALYLIKFHLKVKEFRSPPFSLALGRVHLELTS